MRLQSLKEVAIEEIREMILNGTLKRSSKIDQDALAENLGSSRLPVREALIVLEGEGLVRIVPRRGAFVNDLTREDVKDHYRIFGYVSGLAAEHAAEKITETELKHLDELITTMERNDIARSELDAPNNDFHATINRASRSARLKSMLQSLGRMLPTRTYDSIPDWPEQAHVDHREIVEALRSSDGDSARDLVIKHFSSVAESSIAHLETIGLWDEE